MTKKLIPADTVDAAGNVWETTGENIRRGAKETSIDSMKEIVDILFPVGSIYCGENSFITQVGTWEVIGTDGGLPLIMAPSNTTGARDSSKYVAAMQEVNNPAVAVRFWKRVE